ncbi:uncharacterized protein HMPREF1541_02929 [Cyphellophora europaea CBS 101466]|uniref:Xylanolytic transcriptional activator regulatory domain-containing protein n=1 Tax=Cyphellophora europaea (strain CBS 101466) TaxID=1220924 RepID=W2RX40_CYPE1|nr:uncharacterized protein HMPREF1541_02929 [Cyphellophora europaea CBS 101466]ETN40997.1 hypothetical protein HMPREF1541_02929 [Cyphellophora europaea CBS 101466]
MTHFLRPCTDQADNQDHAAPDHNARRNDPATYPFITPEPTPDVADGHTSLAETNKYPKITQDLARALPPRKELEILLQRVSGIPMPLYQSSYRSYGSNQEEGTQEQISLAGLLSHESHPVLLARQMLLLAAALQRLSSKEEILGITEHHHIIMERLAESAIKMVTTNDLLLGSIEGLETLMLETCYHIDGGNIRRAWITMRRAVMAAQLLGLHRPGEVRFKVIHDQKDLDPKLMWSCIISMERLLSLLMGLPTSATLATASAQATSIPAGGCHLPAFVSDTAAKIIERNEVSTPQEALEMTREIDRELITKGEQIPPEIWRPSSFTGLTIDSEEAFVEIQRCWGHLYYQTLVNQLHLPYMLYSNDAPQRIYSRIACVNASREALNRQIALRTFDPVHPCCRMGDFMALIAGMTLILAHIVSHSHTETVNMFVHQRPGDRAIVERALDRMSSMCEVCDDVLAAKCASLLKYLLAVEADAAQWQKSAAHKVICTNASSQDRNSVLIIKVPYVGTIRIAREGITSIHPCMSGHGQALGDGLTVGGIGSLHVGGQNDGSSGGIAPQAVNQKVPKASSRDPVVQTPEISSGTLFMQQDQMFPNAAATMDEWVFQGFDTAFFDVLMRGAGDQQFDGTGTERWDFGTS